MTITGDTGADHIFPGVLAAAVSWDNVVQGKLSAFSAAILAGVVVTVENAKAGQLSLLSGALN